MHAARKSDMRRRGGSELFLHAVIFNLSFGAVPVRALQEPCQTGICEDCLIQGKPVKPLLASIRIFVFCVQEFKPRLRCSHPNCEGDRSLGWRNNCSAWNRVQPMETRAETTALNYLRFPHGISPRAAIAAVSLAALFLFVVVEFGFSYFAFPTPRAMLLVAAAGALYRCVEFALARKPAPGHARGLAALSICVGLLLPFALAAATRQFHTHYFGLLILPVLEAALYFSLAWTLAVAAAASLSAMFWVAYAAHFTRPFQLGEMLETATLVLLLFTVGTLTWSLLDLVAARDATLRSHVHELQLTRERLLQEEKLAAIGRLASAVAHEIRNPVAIICSAMEAAGSRDLTPSDQAAMSGIALTEARRLAKLTTDFLSYAQPGDLPRTEVDVLLLIGYIASIAKAQAMGRHVAIALDLADGCRLFGNEDQLQQALLNLIRNAIDASPDGGEVFVRCEPQTTCVRITVENGGPQIPLHAVPKIFEPFFTAKAGGTGLGLSIARKIAETHGGTLTLAENREGQIRFDLTLPAYGEPLLMHEDGKG